MILLPIIPATIQTKISVIIDMATSSSVIEYLPLIIKATIILFFFIGFISQTLYWTWIWQLKEYRLDRLRAHFQDIGFWSAFLTIGGFSPLWHTKFPKSTAKAILAIVFSFFASIAILFIVFQNFPLDIRNFNHLDLVFYKNIFTENGFLFGFLLIGYFTMPLIVSLAIGVLNCFGAIFKKIIILRARAKIAKFKDLKVVGITGSYGKSTTKEILADILSKKYKVLRTPANVNTAIGISQFILRELDNTYEIFVVEMGAYRAGEIKEICNIVKPHVGIITAINEQHLALFGSLKNTIKAKFELMDCLPDTGLAVLNIGDANIEEGMELRSSESTRIKAKVIKYSVGAKADVYAMNETSDRKGIKFKLISGVKMKDFSVSIAGVHNVSNVLAAIITAQDLGMDLDVIAQILQKTNYLDVALKNLAGPNGSMLIDDTYNANPDGVFAALRHIKTQRGRKIIVMSSLIELGPRAHEIHQKLGEEISQAAVKVFFLDNYYLSDIKKGAAKNKDSYIEIKREKNPKKIVVYLENELKSSDTVLFINRGARKILESLAF